MDLLGSIPKEFIKIIFRLSLLLFFLNIFSLLLALKNEESFTIAIITLVISLIPTMGSYIILKKVSKE